MILKSPTDNRYYIKPRSVIFSENDMGDPSRVYVSIASGTTIMVNIPDVIPLDEDKQYRKWVLSGFSTKLGTTASYYVYAKLNRSDDRATISFSTKKYEVNGSADGSEASESYFFIAIGTITATDGVSGRTLTYDSGKLTTPDNSYTKEEVDNLVKPWEDIFLSRKEDDTAEGHITFEEGITTKSVSMGGKFLSDVATSTDPYKIENPTDSDIATAAYVDAHGKQKFLSKTTDDTAAGRIIFEKGLRSEDDVEVDGCISASGDATIHGSTSISGNSTVEGTSTVGKNIHVKYDSSTEQPTDKALTIGDFIEEGDIIQGAQITKSGVGSFAGVKSPFMQIYELILNRKTAVQGEFAFSDGDTVDNVTLNEDGSYTLTLREQYEGYITSFKYDDIIYANINIIGNSGEAATTGKCWMRVNSISYDGLSLNVSLYSDDQVPSKKNILPQPYMMITRHGNETDTARQDVWLVSSEDGRMVMLTGVDSPIIDVTSCYATVWGKLPLNLVDYIRQAGVTNLDESQPYLYVRGLVAQDFHRIDYRGKVVREENYRGEWSLETAKNEPYVINDETFDSVTHKGSKWKVESSGTTVEPSPTVTEWTLMVSKGEDSTLTTYDIKPSSNIVYVRETGISVTNLQVTVSEFSTLGYQELTAQYQLDERGLRLEYAIDGEGVRKVLDIGGDGTAIELEDGSGIVVFENDEGFISLEGESIDLNQVKDNITLYLMSDEYGELKNYIIPVVKDGKKGETGKSYSLRVSPSVINRTVDAETGKTIEEVTVDVVLTYLIDGVKYAMSVPMTEHDAVNDDVSIVSVASTDGTAIQRLSFAANSIPITKNIQFTVTPFGTDLPTVTASVAIAFPQRGLVGPAGDAGLMLYPSGYYDEKVKYVQIKDEDGNSVATPFVYYDPLKTGNGDYYVLQKDITEDGIEITNIEYWRPFEKIKYVFTEALMANWARLAQAVFWGDYMFSSDVMASDGKVADYSAFVEKMFGRDGKLTGAVVPNLFLDLKGGVVKTNRLSETFRNLMPNTYTGETIYADRLSLNTSYNVKCPKGNSLLCMPLMSDIVSSEYRKVYFTRSENTPSAPSGEYYDGLPPVGWYDYIPPTTVDGVRLPLWMAIKIEGGWEVWGFPLSENNTNRIRYSTDDAPVRGDEFAADNGYWVRPIGEEAVYPTWIVYQKGTTDRFYLRAKQLSESEYEIDGVHCVVSRLPDLNYEKNANTALRGNEVAEYEWSTILQHCLLLCADPRLLNWRSYRYNLSGHDGAVVYAPRGVKELNDFSEGADMFFSVNGVLTKWLMIEPSAIANLRLVSAEKPEGGVMHIWIVENGSDFDQLDVAVHVDMGYAYDETTQSVKDVSGLAGYGTWVFGGIIGEGSFSGIEIDYVYGENRIGRFYGSKRLRKIYDNHVANNNGDANEQEGYVSIAVEYRDDDDYINEITSLIYG